MKSDKILMLNIGADHYGANKIFLEVARHLKNHGFSPIVVLPNKGPLVHDIESFDIPVTIMNLAVLRRKYFGIIGIFNRLFFFFWSFWKLRTIIKDNSIDLIYSNSIGIFVGFVLARTMRKKHIWHLHEIVLNRWLRQFLGFLLHQSPGKIIAVSNAVKVNWESYIKDKSRILVINNGIDQPKDLSCKSTLRDELLIPKEMVLIGMIGRVSTWKGQDYFLHIAKEISEEFGDVRFVMVGDVYPGNEYLYDDLARLKTSLGITHLVHDLGFRKDISNILNALDIFVSPSTLPDPFPTVILEAMGHSLPVVATDHGGVPEMIVNGKSGILIPWNDPVKAKKIIKPLIVDKNIRASLGRNARNRVLTNFSKETFDFKIVRIFSETLEKG